MADASHTSPGAAGESSDGLRQAVVTYLAALDAQPEKDCWDTESGEEEPGAQKFASDWAWAEWHEARDKALGNLRAALATGGANE